MARAGQTAQEFIKDSFSPIVAVLCSQKVENVVSKNNLTFTELLQPFTKMEAEGQLKEPGSSTCVIKNWKLIIRDVNWKPVQPTEARRQLNNAVLHNYNDKTIPMEFEGRKFDIPQLPYWFDAWRETYLEVQFPSDHEFTKHFLSCIIVGVAHDDNVIDSFNELNHKYSQLQNVAPPKLPKWFNSGTLKSYLLLHDASVISREKAEVTFEALKQTFGASNCFLLTINSKSASDPILNDLWAPYIKRTETNTHSFSGSSESVSVTSKLDLSMETHGSSLNMIDIDDINKFLQDYALKTLLPYVEKQISQLTEVNLPRKPNSRIARICSEILRLGWALDVSRTIIGRRHMPPKIQYTSDCPELQLRRLVRATLLSVLCLSSASLHGEAAKQLIRMTSEDSDLRSAMLLEQASLCFLAGPGSKAMCRKYAFHMVYGESGWRLATDHVQFALGRLASALRNGREALRWLAAPLHAAPAPARQHHQQQAAFLREYMLAHQTLPVLPLPFVEQRATCVLCVGPAPLSSPGRRAASSLSLADTSTPTDHKIWNRLEQMLLQVAQGSVPMIFKPTVDLYNDATDCDPLTKKNNVVSSRAHPNFDHPIESSQDLFSAEGSGIIVEIRYQFRLVNVGEEGNENGSGVTISGKLELLSGVKSTDRRLQIAVIPEAPCLQ
ncbi:TRS85-like protein, partial [Operophtera brumata]